MSAFSFEVRTQAPFLRLLIPFIFGIISGYELRVPPVFMLVGALCCLLIIFLFPFLKSLYRFSIYWVSGILVSILMFCIGALAIYVKDVTHDRKWLGHYSGAMMIYGKTVEPVSVKPKSLKTVLALEYMVQNDKLYQVSGNIIIYFHKDSLLKNLPYGTGIIFTKAPVPIVSSGAPGSFDYKRYAGFQGIYHQVYLSPGTYAIDFSDKSTTLTRLLLKWKEDILLILEKYIPGKKESGLAEALLVGYKDNLEKSLVQSYSNTGVVHVIAISGLHLGLIYWILSLILKPFGKKGMMKTLRLLIIISGLWIFSIIAGASPSILRSAVMFSFIVAGEFGSRKTPILNSLSASAFLLLCYNPYWIFDAGFQLSYIAVLSLVLFMRPVYNSIYIKNKLIDLLWQLSAVTIAAQILTTPVSIFMFHQFPVYFLITNLVAIPLSSLILVAEIGLIAISPFHDMACIAGMWIHWLLMFMNEFIAYVEKIPGGKLQMLSINFYQLMLMYAFIGTAVMAIIKQSRRLVYLSLLIVTCFAIARFISFYHAGQRHRLIVFNANGKVISVINGRDEWMIRDGKSTADPNLEDFQLKPCRIIHRIRNTRTMNPDTCRQIHISIKNKNILILNQPAENDMGDLRVDVLILGKGISLPPEQIEQVVKNGIIVFDNGAGSKKISKWKSACEALSIRYWDVSEKGAFVLTVN